MVYSPPSALHENQTSVNDSPYKGESAPAHSSTTLERRKLYVIARIDNMPVFPRIYNEIIRLSNNPSSSAKEFSELFSSDQILAAKLLRLANSPFFGFAGKVSTINQAVVLLGLNTLRSITLTAASGKLLNQNMSLYELSPNGLSLHSVAVAAVCRHLARKWLDCSRDASEEMFVAGLLHDIGQVPIAIELMKYSSEWQALVTSQSQAPATYCERWILGIDHVEVGQIMLNTWNIGENIAKSIQHHQFNSDNNDDENRLNAIVNVSDYICDEMAIGLDKNYHWQNALPEKALEILNRDEGDIQALKDDLTRISNDALTMFNTD